MVVKKPLYGVPEAGTHWWATYHMHHIKKLQMRISTYDPCLLISDSESFGIVGIQTDNTLILRDKLFLEKEGRELKEANFLAKPLESLSYEAPLIFNRCVLK